MTTGYRFGNAELRPDQRVLLVGGQESHIGSRAFDLLVTLVEQRGRVVSKNELIDSVWSGLVVEENNLQVHISSLRKVLGPQAIATVPGRGYRFTARLDAVGAGQIVAAAVTPPALDASFPGANVQAVTNLPAELPMLYGRERELAALLQTLASHRLVTVVGAGGMGKTTLAQAVASQLRGDFADGVWRVDLSPLADAGLVATTVASVLHVMLRADSQVESLARAAGSRRMLLLLDNCEHVAVAAAELANALYQWAPQVKVLATSQEPLKVAHEQVWRLGALAVPADAADARARQAGAVALFDARARAADPAFVLTDNDLHAVAEICGHLDGIPLAIELAAARVPLLGVAGLRARLGERFRLLTGGSRLALPRHQTLRAALAWSHALLTPEEQAVFRRLGAFAGGFGLEAAQHVAADATTDGWAVLEHLGALIDKSLVVAEPGTQPRYRLLETSRAFAMERLAESGETETVLRRHAQAMLAVFEQSLREEFEIPAQVRADRYLAMLDDARAALDWTAGPEGDVQLQIALAGAVAWIWQPVGLRSEGVRRTRAAMERIDARTPPVSEARLQAAWLPVAWPDVGPAELAAGARAVALFRNLGDRPGEFCVLCDLSRRLSMRDDFEASERCLAEAERLLDPGWPAALRVRLVANRGCCCLEAGSFDACIANYGEAYRVAQALGDQLLALRALVGMEQGYAGLERWPEAVARGREMLAILQRDKALQPSKVGVVLSNLFLALAESGELDEALDVARRAFEIRELEGTGLCILDPLARLAFLRGHIEDAARILGRVDMRYTTSKCARQQIEAMDRERLLAGLRQLLDEAELARLMKAGEALSDDEAGRLALID